MHTIPRLLLGLSFIAALCVSHIEAQTGADESAFLPYTTCQPRNGPVVAETSPLATGITERDVDTFIGPQTIKMLAGRRIMFRYPGEDFYANLKVEILPKEGWDASRTALINNFDYLLLSSEDARNDKLPAKLSGFAVLGQDRTKREGGVLGFYLLLDNSTHTAVTIYFLNQEPPHRFKTMAEYAALRDSFLTSYTRCVRKSLAAK